MRLTAAELRNVFNILETIEAGKAAPEIPGHVGRFFRQYGRARAELEPILTAHGLKRRDDDAVSGRLLGPITVQQMFDADVRSRGRRLGEVAETLVICEELGCLASLAMWVKAQTASMTFDTLRLGQAVCLEGDFRWTPPARITPGEARVTLAPDVTDWRNTRLIKAVADDLTRPPHALEYVRDWRPGKAGLKFFRSVCAIRDNEGWRVLPALGRPTVLRLDGRTKHIIAYGAVAMLLVSREPWSAVWTIEAHAEITSDEALAHSITWADFQRELHGLSFDAAIVAELHHALSSAGVAPDSIGEPNLTRTLTPIAADLIRHIRRISPAGGKRTPTH